MKFIIVVLLFSPFYLFSQISDTIDLSFTKSGYLIFPSDKIEFDIGSEDVAVKNFANRLVLQVLTENFEETNLFVECSGKIYMFIIRYVEKPRKYLYDFGGAKTLSSSVDKTLTDQSLSSSVITYAPLVEDIKKDSMVKVYQAFCDKIINEPDRIMNRGVVKYKIGIYLKDIVIFDDKMFFEFEARNTGNIPYIIDFYEYRVKSTKRRIKGESFQEVQLNPILEYSRPERIDGKTSYKYVIVMDKFALTKNKKLVIEHWEDNGKDLNIEGGRKIDFDIFSNDVLNVRL